MAEVDKRLPADGREGEGGSPIERRAGPVGPPGLCDRLIVPFLAGFQNFLGWLIIGFGLWQAWSMNKAQAFEVDGPYRLGDGEAVAGTG